MKLFVVKLLIVLMPVLGVISIALSIFAGHITVGWIIFISLLLLSGIINILFFRCPHCKKTILVYASGNQKYCPHCGGDTGIIPSKFGYYSKCARRKNGDYVAYTMVGINVFLVSTLILVLVIAAVFGIDKLFRGMGLILVIAAILIGMLLGFMCRCIVGSKAVMNADTIKFCKIPFVWREYSIDHIRKVAEEDEPFYHRARGYVMATERGVLILPVNTYKGGEEFLIALTKRLDTVPPTVSPDQVIAVHSEEAREDEEKLKIYEKKYPRVKGKV